MRTYITRINGWSLRDKSHYMQHMVAEIGHQLGFREMGIYRLFWEEEGWESLSSRLDGIIAGINSGDLIIYQFPTGNGMRFENELMNRIKAYGGRLAIFVHEMEFLADEEKKSQQGSVIGLLNQAEVLIVPTYAMRQWFIENGIRKNMKYVVQEMWDCTVNEPLGNEPTFKKEIYFTDGEGFAGMDSWNYPVTLKLYHVSTNPGQNVQNLGEREPYQLLSELHKGGFGMVWHKDEYSRNYMEQSNSFSLARYLAAGIPVIVPVGNSHQTLIVENRLGFVVDSLDEAAAVVEKITEEEYRDYVKSVEQFAPALRNGYYTKKCLIEAMQAFYRKDAGRLPLPERVYKAGENAFRSVALNESYGGNLAFSWDFQGEADGVLIYDTAGKLLENTRDSYQHYLLLKGTEKEKGVIAKAYVETLRGKLILAESETAYLQERSYDNFSVSMVVPAYNAENYIARCIDTILAQSQPNVEIVVVDDGSMDNTRKVIEWYAENYKNVVLIHQENNGAATARNTGVRRAKGEYVGFVDADDMIRPNMAKRLYQSAKKNDCDIAITSAYAVMDTEYIKKMNYPVIEDVPIAVEDFFPIYSHGDGVGVVVWNKIYRASLVKTRMFPIMPYEDDAWTPYILSYANKVCFLNDFSYEWDRRNQSNSLSESLSRRSAGELFKDRKSAVLYSLERGNSKQLANLKKVALEKVAALESYYGNKEYGALWDEIKAKY
ncbi:MAG: glycosyltransferase [Ruminococcus flavefaciens]|nr:glycosyltransferase [Ruminococcus flavefaciens]